MGYETKLKSDGSVESLNAPLVAKEYTQASRIDFDETCTFIRKPTTIRVVLTTTVMKNWIIRKVNVRMPFKWDS